MGWSDTFRGYIDRRFAGDSAQQKAAEALDVSPSAVSYWCRGSKPRQRMRERIAEWSDGEVPAVVVPPEAASSAQALDVDDDPAGARTGTADTG